MITINIYHFSDLSPELRERLTEYIANRFTSRKTINKKYSAYALKQTCVRELGTPIEHITTQCFMEAMIDLGYTATPVPKRDGNWFFNVSV